MQTWDLYYPYAAATGLPFARGRLDDTDVLWVHSAEALTVEVRDDDGRVLGRGKDLPRTGHMPFCRLTHADGTVVRNDGWPGTEHLGEPIILPGGEVGILKSFWHAEDEDEWRWTAEFYNQRRG